MKSLTIVALLCGLAITALADTYPRQTGVDAIHYVLRLTLNDDNDEIAGEATADVAFLKDALTEFSLDLASPNNGKGMTVSEVACGGAQVRYVHQKDRLVITLASPSKAGEWRQCTVKYRGTPASGLCCVRRTATGIAVFSA